MIDHQTRIEAFNALRRFVAGETTNIDYESEYPSPRKWRNDRAIHAIYEFSWNWFDDFCPHKLEGRHALNEETKRAAERCLLFLQSDAEYEWTETRFIKTDAPLSTLVTPGSTHRKVTLDEQLAAHLSEPEGDSSTWPFFRKSDYKRTLQFEIGVP